MTDVGAEAAAYVSERADGAETVRHLLDVDAGREAWTFDDLDLDSGTFGEVVSRGLVEEVDDGYAVADRTALAAAIDADDAVTDAPADHEGDDAALDARSLDRLSLDRFSTLASLDRATVGGLVAVLAVVVLFRALTYGAVFRDWGVVLLGNDPYAYWHWTDVLLSEYGRFDPTALGSLPAQIAGDDVTLFLTLWAFLSVAPGALDALLAWYPVLAAVGTGLAVYAMTTQLTPDKRVGLAAVVMLAITPVHAYRTTVGFADHHAFDYLMLAVVLAGLAALSRDRVRRLDLDGVGDDWRARTAAALGDRRALAVAALFGVALFAQVFAWRGSPILVAPLALYVTALAFADLRSDVAPLARNRYLLVGLAVATAIAPVAYFGVGLGSSFRALLPGALLLGALAVFATGEVVHRLDLSPTVAAVSSASAMALVGAVLWFGTSLFDRLVERGGSWVTGALGRQTAGTDPLFSTQLGNVLGPLLVFGVVLVIAVPVVAWLTAGALRGERVEWLAPAVYFWYLLGWTTVFVRFGGSLAVAAAPFAGYAFVFLPAKIEAVRRPVVSYDSLPAGPRGLDDLSGSAAARSDGGGSAASRDGPTPRRSGAAPAARDDSAVPDLRFPSRGTAAWILAFFLVVGSFSFVQIPIKGSQLAVGEGVTDTARWIDGHTEANGVDSPDNYVLSTWDKNRVYNRFVSGDSASYTYAEDNYGAFATSTRPLAWYERLVRDDVGYVVLTRNNMGFAADTMYARLFRHYGSQHGDVNGVGTYRAVYTAPGGNRRVFTPVQGTILTGTAQPNTRVTVETDVDVVHDTVTYRRTTRSTRNGHFAVRVPQTGTYESHSGTPAVTVSEHDIHAGGFAVNGRSPESRWSFDERQGTVAFDQRGTNHGFVYGAEWTNVDGDGIVTLRDGARVTVPEPANVSAGAGVTLSARFRAAESVDYRNDRRFAPIVASAPESGANIRASGFSLAMSKGTIAATYGDGDSFRHIEGPRVDDGAWHNATLQFENGRLELYLDGELVASDTFDGGAPPAGQSLYVGGPPGGTNFAGQVDDVAFSTPAADDPTSILANRTG